MGSKRGDRSLHPWRPVRAGQTHGYKGQATDAEADPAVVLPQRTVLVPAAALSPLAAAGGGSVAAGGATPGEVVVDPPELAPAIAEALESAASPSAGNPMATLADVSGMLMVVRTLTAAEVQTLFSIPVTLVPGVVGTVYVPFLLVAIVHVGAVQIGAAPQKLAIGNQAGVGGLLTATASNFLISAVDAYGVGASSEGQPFDYGGPLSMFDGADMEVYLTDSDPTQGDGTLELAVLYRVVDVS